MLLLVFCCCCCGGGGGGDVIDVIRVFPGFTLSSCGSIILGPDAAEAGGDSQSGPRGAGGHIPGEVPQAGRGGQGGLGQRQQASLRALLHQGGV